MYTILKYYNCDDSKNLRFTKFPGFHGNIPGSTATRWAIAATTATSKTSHTGAATSTSSGAGMLNCDPGGKKKNTFNVSNVTSITSE